MDSKENDDDEGLSRDEFGNVIPPPAWEDSDDNQLTISLARDSRLRKLRNTETEDLIDGREYIRRLRRQFLQLHPTPAWADPGQNLQRRKKARKVNSDESDDDSNTDEIGPDGNEVSAQPLAKLLQSAGDIIQRPNDSKRVGKRRLRQEMIEIHRLKDVGVDQPVSAKWKLEKHTAQTNELSSRPSILSLSTHIIRYCSPLVLHQHCGFIMYRQMRQRQIHFLQHCILSEHQFTHRLLPPQRAIESLLRVVGDIFTFGI